MGWSYTSNGGIVFDLDDPRFTSPMSVISGLASGYCERRAAVDDTYAAASWTTDAVKENTVSRLAANIAINQNIGTVSAYGAGSETFQAPQSWTADNQTKTFMDYFDHDLMDLAHMYVTSGGTAYTDFRDFAEYASDRAWDDEHYSNYGGYCVDTVAASGGKGVESDEADYTGTFVPTFAAGWAVERRDMLEELMYSIAPATIAKLDTTQASGGDYNVQHDFGIGFNFAYISGTITNCYNFTSDSDSDRDMDFPYYTYADGILSGAQLERADVSATYKLDGLVTEANNAATVTVTVYMGDSYEYHQRYADYLCVSGHDVRTYVSTAVIAANNVGYCVVEGGTLTVPNGVDTQKVTVESGGSIVFQGPGSLVELLFLEQGATVVPFTSQGMLYRYSLGMAWNFVDAGADFIIGVGNTPDPDQTPESIPASEKWNYIYVATGDMDPPANARKIYAIDGAAVTRTDMSDVYVSGATFTTAATGEVNNVIVDNGGLYIMSGAAVGEIEVMPGGTVSLCSPDSCNIGTLHVRSGGSAVITGTRTKLSSLIVHDGSYLNVAAGVIDAEYKNADGDWFVYYINIYHFCTFGLVGNTWSVDTKPTGWLEVQATSLGDDMYRLYGVNTAAEGLTKISSYIQGGLGNMAGRISGSVTVGSVQYSNIEAAYKYTPGDTCYVHYGAQILAKNRRATGGSLTNHYPEFTYRKFNDDEHE